MAYISKITLPSGTYDIKDTEARKLISDLAAKGITFTIAKDAGTTPLGVEWMNGDQQVIGTLAASADITSIYLVPRKSKLSHEYHEEYVVVNEGSDDVAAYVWEKLGDTDVSFENLGALAKKDSATGTITTAVTNVTSTLEGGKASVSGSYTPAGTITGSFTGNSLTSNGNVTAEGTVTSTLSGASATFSKEFTPEGTISASFSGSKLTSTGNVTAKGTIDKPAITVTPSTTTSGASKITSAGSVTAGEKPSFTEGAFHAGSFTAGTDQFVKPTLTTSVADETLTITFTQGSFTQGEDKWVAPSKDKDTWSAGKATEVTLPKFTHVNILSGVAAELATAPKFTGSSVAVSVSGTPTGTVGADFTGSAATIGATAEVTGNVNSTFSGSSVAVSVTGKPTGNVSATFSGTGATITASGDVTGTVNNNLTKDTITVTVK